jgi:hypothetical protein
MPRKCITDCLQNRYKELGRISRAWRSLQEWKRHGCGHTKNSPGPSKLTVQCPACPTPGVNLPADWLNKDDDKNLYTVQLAVDGNFSAVHQRQKNEDVWFNDGKGFLVEEAPYLQHLRSATVIKEVLVPPSVLCLCPPITQYLRKTPVTGIMLLLTMSRDLAVMSPALPPLLV